MKIKVSEATLTQLDWLVGSIDQPDWTPEDLLDRTFGYCDSGDPDDEPWEPSTNWAQGGPIIEREYLELHTYSPNDDGEVIWRCNDHFDGPTPLIAAMREYVYIAMGYKVEVPEELK